ncbi:hypothetical protein [Romboutsia sp.]|uniref:hypothetical protein n=1 Tax=Romboutsia sp. TaxID=1965302 RepID=UPI003F2C6721
MCLYNYNNKFSSSDAYNTEEYLLLSQIYESIASNDNEKAIELTKQLIAMQSSDDSIKTLQKALNSLK